MPVFVRLLVPLTFDACLAVRPCWLAWVPAALLLSGCAALGHRGPVPKAVATCRELSCQGVAAVEAGEWERAEKLLRQAIQHSPSDTVARRHLAEVLWQRGVTSEALLQMEAAMRLDTTDAALAVRSGEMLLATGSIDKALERAELAVGADPQLAEAWALRGRVFWHQNDMDRALADLQRALQFKPDASDVLLDLAALYRQRGQHQSCLTTLHHLLDKYSPGSEPQFALFLEGLTLSDLNRIEDAIASYRAASQRGKPNAEILYYLARAELAAGHLDAASLAARQALAADRSHEPSKELLVEIARPPTNDGHLLR